MKDIADIDLRQVIEDLTGEKFNRENKIHSPFKQENTPSFSIYFDSNSNKQKFKDFSTGEQGDVLDFVMKFKNCSYREARSYLGLETEQTEIEAWEDKVRKYIDWQLQDSKRGYKLLGVFIFVDKDNNPIYCKAKFLKPDGKKETPYYSIDNEKVVNKRNYDEVPYNYYNLLKGIAEDKTIVFVEGEKDANTINNILKNKNFVASSLKGVKNFENLKSEYMNVYVIGDTGDAGQRYIQNIKQQFFEKCSKFKIINLPGIKSLGDNKDVTDWLEAGHNKNDLFNAFDRSLDLKNKYELQQDHNGIYKTQFDKSGENPRKVYITDFQLLDAKNLIRIDDESEDIILKLKSCINGIVITRKKSSSVFNDLRSFRNFLGAKLSFSGDMNDLVKFKMWVNKYFATEDNSIYSGTKFIAINNKLSLVSADGTISAEKIDNRTLAEGSNVKIIDKKEITTQELLELKNRILRFAPPEKSISIIGTVINNLAVYQSIDNDIKLHHLFITGESESGKSTIVEQIIAPILNYPLEDKKSFLDTPYAIIQELSNGNYPVIYDEFKPSTFSSHIIQKLSNILRNLYDRVSVSRGNKSFTVDTFRLQRPIIIIGEESYPNQEKALITRSCIVYLSRNERSEKTTEATFWLIKHKELLNKFGKSLINEILNMSSEQYKEIRESLLEKFQELRDRPQNIALNIACGIEIFNLLLERHGLLKIEKYEEYIINNIKEEVLDNSKDAKSVVEQMLVLYNDMIEDQKTCVQDTIIQDRPEGFYIRTSQLINEIFRFIKDYGSAEVSPIKIKDFRKQAAKSGYILSINAKQLRVGSNNPVWYDLYDKEKLKELNVTSIVEPDLIEEAVTAFEQKVIDGVFKNK